MQTKTLPPRSAVPAADTWDLSSLFTGDEAWEAAFTEWEAKIPGFARFQGKLGSGPATLAECLAFDLEVDRLGERLSNYAFLRSAEDTANSAYQRMLGRYRNAASRAAQAASYIRPELLALPQARLDEYLAAEAMRPYRLILERILLYKPYTLGEREEKLLAMQSETAATASLVFRQLNNADLKFGNVTNERGESLELTHASFATLLHSPAAEVRKTAFHQYYRQFAAHENTLAATLAGSIQQDVYQARARGYDGSLAQALYPDRVPLVVYDNLIASVRRHLPAVHRYYELRRRKMGLAEIHHYDTYVPILSDLDKRHEWHEAVDVILAALAPLGREYGQTLRAGLLGRWCDRYENQNKQSGAFSSGSYESDPFILMNYQPDVLDHVFTLAHEAGHSMHTWYSAHAQPYQYYGYTIFVAEVASTFNEQLLIKHLVKQAGSPQERAYLINREIDSIRATIVRQTMFAEFEKLTHELAERNEPLTVERFKTVYRELLEQYFGPQFALDPELSLECFRIPHFYRAFYVYKYATGLSAAIALAERVALGGEHELHDYLTFLKGGCARDPLDLLRGAGVDMERPEAVDTALARFAALVDELDTLL